MANQEHVDILRQGVEVWNIWREEHPEVRSDFSDVSMLINLSCANLSYANLRGANLSRADLLQVDLSRADLRGANLSRADLSEADLFGVDLRGANLSRADLRGVDLNEANLNKANFRGASLRGADLRVANLNEADLTGANLSEADFFEADLRGANIGWTIFGSLDLSNVKGLEAIEHKGPSSIGIDTIYRSSGNIPESFLRGAGVPETFITYARSLVNNPIEYYTCFISYSSRDQAFAERLYADLQANNVRCWYAPEDLKIGDKFRIRIDESIRLYDKLLLVLSEDSLASNWVAYEVEKALNKEPEGTPNVLFPIRLDNTILTCDTDWAKDIRKSRHIGDFEHWKDHDAYQHAFQRLLRDLKAQS